MVPWTDFSCNDTYTDRSSAKNDKRKVVNKATNKEEHESFHQLTGKGMMKISIIYPIIKMELYVCVMKYLVRATILCLKLH